MATTADTDGRERLELCFGNVGSGQHRGRISKLDYCRGKEHVTLINGLLLSFAETNQTDSDQTQMYDVRKEHVTLINGLLQSLAVTSKIKVLKNNKFLQTN